MPKRKKRKSETKQWFIIYEICNIKTNEKYVGITGVKNRKWDDYLNKRLEFHVKRAESKSDTLICQNISKYGVACFSARELTRVQGKQTALNLEKEYIKSGCYNLNMVHRTAKNLTYKSILKRLKLLTDKLPPHPGFILKNQFLPYIDIPLNDFAELAGFIPSEFLHFIGEDICPSYSQCIFISKITNTPPKFWIQLLNDYLVSRDISNIDMEKYKKLPVLIKSVKENCAT